MNKRLLTISSQSGIEDKFFLDDNDLTPEENILNNKEQLGKLVDFFGESYFIFGGDFRYFKEPTLEQVKKCIYSNYLDYDHYLVEISTLEC